MYPETPLLSPYSSAAGAGKRFGLVKAVCFLVGNMAGTGLLALPYALVQAGDHRRISSSASVIFPSFRLVTPALDRGPRGVRVLQRLQTGQLLEHPFQPLPGVPLRRRRRPLLPHRREGGQPLRRQEGAGTQDRHQL